MSEFHRMITYLYLYERGLKSRSIGFAKIEKRDQRCLLEIHMKNTGCSLSPVPVYFYARKNDVLAGIPLGNFSLTRGNGEFKAILDGNNLEGTGCSLDEVKGIYIPISDQLMLVSQWDDDEFHREEFAEYQSLSDRPHSAKIPEDPDTAAAASNPPVSDTRDSNTGSFTAVQADASDASAPVLKAAEALPRTETSAPERTAGFRSISGKHQEPKHPQADSTEDWSLRWRFILENYPVMTPFFGDENTLCVRLELKDLRQLPKPLWYLGNNSFLLHGFFNYRYLILGMTEESGRKQWFLGIPGVFQNPERVMAALFGFPEFRSENPSPVKTGEFGYWYRCLNELP